MANVEDRHGRETTIISSQLPMEHWHEWFGEETLADAIMASLGHDASIITPKGDSMGKRMAETLEFQAK